MKRLSLIFFVTLFCFLMTGPVSGNESASISNADTSLNPLSNEFHPARCENIKLQKSAFETGDPEHPFLLQRNQQECLNKCTQEFNSCMSGAGDDANKKFRCGESRWMCTRGCDNSFAPQLNSL